MQFIHNLATIAPEYDGFILDVWGVLHDGVQPFQEAIATVDMLKALGKEIVVVSNAPRPAAKVAAGLDVMGFTLHSDQIITSGDVVNTQVFQRQAPEFSARGQHAFHLGHRDHPLVVNAPVKWVDRLADADYLLVTMYFDAKYPTNSFDDVLTAACELKLPMVCANPDKIAPVGDSFNYCAGTLAERYEEMGGQVFYYGKPHDAIYQAARAKFNEYGLIEGAKILAIGDTIETDILGAYQQGFDSALVLCGIEGRKLPEHPTQEDIENLCHRQDLPTPTWVISELRF